MNGSNPTSSEVYKSVRPVHQGDARTKVINRRSPRDFDFAGVDAAELCAFIEVCAGNGDLCCIGLTSDRGALSITVVSGSTRYKTYAKDGDELLLRLHDLRDEVY